MFSPECIAAAKAHALDEFPKESVGFVVGGDYIPLRNIHENPEEHFLVADEDYEAYEDVLQAVIHSHPGGPDHPTASDMRSQMAVNVPFGIVSVKGGIANDPFFWGDGVPAPPLIGRDFKHGVTDCYALVRDYYRLERGVVLNEYPRDYEWWYKDQNLYGENFLKEGFKPFSGELAPGDGFLAQIHSHVPNHAGVYVGNGLIMHHLVNRLSRVEPVMRWQRMITTWLRYSP